MRIWPFVAVADSVAPDASVSVSIDGVSLVELPDLPVAWKVIVASVWLPVRPAAEAPMMRTTPLAKLELQSEPAPDLQSLTLTVDGS